jgi:hypothetical protein
MKINPGELYLYVTLDELNIVRGQNEDRGVELRGLTGMRFPLEASTIPVPVSCSRSFEKSENHWFALWPERSGNTNRYENVTMKFSTLVLGKQLSWVDLCNLVESDHEMRSVEQGSCVEKECVWWDGRLFQRRQRQRKNKVQWNNGELDKQTKDLKWLLKIRK